MDNLTFSKVQEIQHILKKLGHYNYNIDGIIGDYTKEAVKSFQISQKLQNHGNLDNETLGLLYKYIQGYFEYTIKPGDTLFRIAKNNNSTDHQIITANPGINPFMLKPGDRIIVPYCYEVVPTDISYSYDVMLNNIIGLSKRYPFLKYDSIGKSVDGREIYRLRIGEGDNHVIYNAAHHANEWITSPLLMKWLETFLFVYSLKGSIKGFNTEDIWGFSTIDLIPMVNPDGVELVINGLDDTTNKEQILSWNNYNEDFSGWKANSNGVDLNRNYNAGWDQYQKVQRELGVYGPAPSYYSGKRAESEPEAFSLAEFTRKINPRLVLAFHTQGQVIYWQYNDLRPEEAYPIGLELAKLSGYTLETEPLSASSAGYKDYFIQDFRKPGYTIEVGLGENPISIDQFDIIYDNNEELLLYSSSI